MVGFLVAFISLFYLTFGDGTPEQIHIALTDKPDEMSVMWLTPDDVNMPVVQYGLTKSLGSSQTAYESTHYYWIDVYKSGAIHSARLTGLKPNVQYFYRVGDSSAGWSDIMTFKTDRQLPIRFIATGDVGTEPYCDSCGAVLNGMLKEHAKQPIDFVMHSGDLSYANGEQPVWDQWQNMMQPLASTVPYMASVGNHETLSLWLAFLKRFDYPAGESGGIEGNLFYSFDFGPIHFIALSSEYVEFWHFLSQYRWLEKDLESVDRSKTPWVFTSWHRPWYCSNNAHQGSGSWMMDSYEDLFYKHKVDIMFVGHVHAYERTHPIYKGKVVSDGIVTITNGNGGNHEGLATHWENPQPVWSAYRESYFGFGIATVYNSTHLNWEAFRADNQSVADQWWFVRQH